MASGTSDELDRKIRGVRASIALSLRTLNDAATDREDAAHLRTAIARQRGQLQVLLKQEADAQHVSSDTPHGVIEAASSKP